MTSEVSVLLLGIQWSNQTIFLFYLPVNMKRMCDPNSLFQSKEKMLSGGNQKSKKKFEFMYHITKVQELNKQ